MARQTLATELVPGFTQQSRTIAGAAAGNLTVLGIKLGDKLLLVQPVTAVGANLASEFTITAADTINNTGGTSTAGVVAVLVTWLARSAKLGYAGE